jgi:hypothetical protein
MEEFVLDSSFFNLQVMGQAEPYELMDAAMMNDALPQREAEKSRELLSRKERTKDNWEGGSLPQ